MSYRLADIPRVLTVLAGTTDVSHSDELMCERIDAQRAWARMPNGAHKRMLYLVCAEDMTITLAAAKCGLYPARARATLEEAAALLLWRLNNKEYR